MKRIALIFALALGLSASVYGSDSTCNNDHKLSGSLFDITKETKPAPVSAPQDKNQSN